jgi:MOSC domain-containing protein YiiM
MPKLPVPGAQVTAEGVAGDSQRNRKFHGGPDRAICLYSEELYEFLRDNGIAVSAGQIGENFTTRGLDLASLQPGDRLRVGGCVVEITAVRVPCSQLRKWGATLPEVIVGRSGWVAKVTEPGPVQPGDEITVLER